MENTKRVVIKRMVIFVSSGGKAIEYEVADLNFKTEI